MPRHRHLWYLPPVPFQGKTACLSAWLALSLCRLVYYLATAWAHGKVLPTPFKYGKGDNLAVL